MATNPLGRLFGRSPIGPIQEHMGIAGEAAQFIPQLLQASMDQDWKRSEEIYRAVNKAEKQADKLKRSIRRHLPKSLFLPVPRNDLLELLAIQDHVANIAKDIGILVTSREMQFPGKLHEEILEFAGTCVSATSQAQAVINELDELLEVGFSGREVKRVEAMLKELDKLEEKTDKQSLALRKKMFPLEGELPPVDVMYQYRVLALLSELADASEKVGDRLQILMAR